MALRALILLLPLLATCVTASDAPGNSDASFPALATTIQKAKEGSARDQSILGDYYLANNDFTNAVIWYRRAAEKGESEAMLSLAGCYVTGRGTPQDPKEAARWLDLASIQIISASAAKPASVVTNEATFVVPALTGSSPSAQAKACSNQQLAQSSRCRSLDRIEPTIIQVHSVLRPTSVD